ncbi:MAG TPA: PorV/PorQ family protein [Bacteroidota bacterium]|jgi:hypothetical protein|nr:PorV/PorQ family protein [Bacteroidota bacterium]
MKRKNCSSILFAVVLLALAFAAQPADAQLIPNLGGQRAGISALPFLKIGAGSRGTAMGESFTAVANDASALYWNPAGLVQFSDNQVYLGFTWYVVDIDLPYLGVVYHLSPNDAVGLSMTSLRTEDMEITTETQPFGTGQYASFGDIAFGLSYSRKMTDQFSFGVTTRYVEETLDILKMRGLLFDLGTYYWTGIGSSRFAVVVTNFGADVSPSGEVHELGGATVSSFQSFSPPTQFKLGFAFEPMQTDDQRITTSVELNHPNDNAENVHLGVEYEWKKMITFRLGTKRTIGERLLGEDNSSSADFSAGFGVAAPINQKDILFDYSYQNYNKLGAVHRISLGIPF